MHKLSPNLEISLKRIMVYHGRVVRGEMGEKEPWGSCIKGNAHSTKKGLVGFLLWRARELVGWLEDILP